MSSSKNQKLCGVKDREASALKRFERIIMKEVETSVGGVNILSRHHLGTENGTGDPWRQNQH
jgi:hypothetical protein